MPNWSDDEGRYWYLPRGNNPVMCVQIPHPPVSIPRKGCGCPACIEAKEIKTEKAAIERCPKILEQLYDVSLKYVTDYHGKQHPIQLMAGGAVRGVDIGNFRIVTQNPNTHSKWALKALGGEQIGWLIHKPSNRFIARIQYGMGYDLSNPYFQ